MRHTLFVFKTLLAALLLPILPVSGTSLEKVLQKHAEALGGHENLQRINTVYVEGTIEFGGMAGKTTVYSKSPDKYRIDLVLPIMSQIQACDGDDCWSKDKSGFAQTLTLEFEAMLHTQKALDRWTILI